MTTGTRRSRRELVTGYLRAKRELAEMIGEVRRPSLLKDIAMGADSLAWREVALAQHHAGCDHDLEKACCKTRAALDPGYSCDTHTGGPEAGFPEMWGMDDPVHVTLELLEGQRELLVDALAERNVLAIQQYRDDLGPVAERGADPRVREEATAQLQLVADWEGDNRADRQAAT